jgi:hypothetical protein
MGTKMNTCKTCKWWDRANNYDYGYCQKLSSLENLAEWIWQDNVEANTLCTVGYFGCILHEVKDV